MKRWINIFLSITTKLTISCSHDLIRYGTYISYILYHYSGFQVRQVMLTDLIKSSVWGHLRLRVRVRKSQFLAFLGGVCQYKKEFWHVTSWLISFADVLLMIGSPPIEKLLESNSDSHAINFLIQSILLKCWSSFQIFWVP